MFVVLLVKGWLIIVILRYDMIILYVFKMFRRIFKYKIIVYVVLKFQFEVYNREYYKVVQGYILFLYLIVDVIFYLRVRVVNEVFKL